jgi:F420-0:gamma-glutamyl ligase
MNHVDSLAAAAVYTMGEGSECQPLAILQGMELEWTDASTEKEITIPPQDDLYWPIFQNLID